MKIIFSLGLSLLLALICGSSAIASTENISTDEIDLEISRIDDFHAADKELHHAIRFQFKALRTSDVHRALLLSAGVGLGLSTSGMALGSFLQMPMEQSLLASTLVSIFGIFPGMIYFASGSISGEKLTGVRNAFHYEIAEFHRYWSHSTDAEGFWVIDRPMRFTEAWGPKDFVQSAWKKIERLDEVREELERKYLLGSLSHNDHDRFQVSIDYYHSFYKYQLLKLLRVQLENLKAQRDSGHSQCESTLRHLVVFRGR